MTSYIETISQNYDRWGNPSFWVNGKRVKMEIGLNLILAGHMEPHKGAIKHLEKLTYVKNPEFYILNDVESSEELCICQKIGNGRCRYISKKWRASEDDMAITSRATRVKDYGFDIQVKGNKARFKRTGESIVTYPDGLPRDWHGSDEFELTLWGEVVR